MSRGGGLRLARDRRGRRRAGIYRHQLRAPGAGAGHPDRAGRWLAEGARAGNKSYEWSSPTGISTWLPRRPGRAGAQLPQQRLIPARWSRARVCSCVGDESRLVIPPRSRTSCGSCSPWSPASRSRTSGDRAGRGRRLRLEAAGHGRGSARGADRPQAAQAGQVDRVPQRGNMTVPTAGPVAADQDRGGPRTAVRGLSVDLLADMGAYLMLVTPRAGCSVLSCSPASTRWTLTRSAAPGLPPPR